MLKTIMMTFKTDLLKEMIDMLPYLTAMINASLREGHLPASQKLAIITPLVKKSSLDANELKNYRPVSNLSFLSKVVEKIVAEQFTAYLQANDPLPRLQSAYRRHHSTKTALRVLIVRRLRCHWSPGCHTARFLRSERHFWLCLMQINE